MRRALITGAALLAIPAVALAEAPSNDAPSGAMTFEEFTAANGTPTERQGVIDLTEAKPDSGIARCLGRKSFAKTVWFRVPAADKTQRVRVEASSPTNGGTSEVPDLALYVGAGKPKVANSCDGPAAGARSTSAAAVEALVPAGAGALVQIGRSAGQSEQRAIASLLAEPLAGPGGKAPKGDSARKAPAVRVGQVKTVALAGATLTAEDPAQPACPAAATVWRRTKVKATGRHRIVARGAGAGSLTAFVGAKPTADNAKACVNRAKPSGAVALAVRLKRGDLLWTRIGVDGDPKGSAKLRVKLLK